MTFSSEIVPFYIAHLVAVNISELVPDQLSADQEEDVTRQGLGMVATCRLPSKVTISTRLVEDMSVQLMLKLHPLRDSDSKQLSQQDFLSMCCHVSTV